jgi:hypothetical protein
MRRPIAVQQQRLAGLRTALDMQLRPLCRFKLTAKTHLAAVERQRKAPAHHSNAGGRRLAIDAEDGVYCRHHGRQSSVHHRLVR